MMKILKESFQDVSDYLRSSDIKEELIEEFPEIKDYPDQVEDEVNRYIIDLVEERFSDAKIEVVLVSILKIVDSESEIVAQDHPVIEFNGVLYDYTAHQFIDSYSGLLSYSAVPVTQQVVTNERQLTSGISSVKSYAMLKEV